MEQFRFIKYSIFIFIRIGTFKPLFIEIDPFYVNMNWVRALDLSRYLRRAVMTLSAVISVI